MSLVDELAKLQQLKESGALTDDEFLLAKQRLLSEGGHEPSTSPLTPESVEEIVDEPNTLGQAANRYVTYQYQSRIIGAVVAIIALIIFAIIASRMQAGFNSFSPFGH